MTKAYALRRLLEHGPMTRPEIVACTGWSVNEVHAALRACRGRREVHREPRRTICGSWAPGAYRAV
jgi:hypothetical protein